ncbi:MAG: thioesterase family protein, partial [Betaproteobacteria bacterium]|nr:thioesterase family protein [Betaproteobacteria bacterium]
MRRSQDEQQAFEQSLTEIFERHICFNQVLGLTVIALKPEQTEIRFAMRPDLIGHFAYGRLHGGVISATLDATAGCAVMVGLAEKHPDESAQQVIARFAKVGTIDLRVDYLRQGLGQYFTASAKLTRIGGRIASAQMALHNDEALLIA